MCKGAPSVGRLRISFIIIRLTLSNSNRRPNLRRQSHSNSRANVVSANLSPLHSCFYKQNSLRYGDTFRKFSLISDLGSLVQRLIQDFFIEGGNSRTQHRAQTRGVWGHDPPEIFEILQPLRLFLVASETTYTNKKLLYIILLHSTIV